MPESRLRLILIVLASFASLAAVGCERGENTQQSESKPVAATTPAPNIKTPPKFGVFLEGTDGPVSLDTKPQVTPSPSFLIYLENLPEPAKVRLRFGKGSASGFMVNSGTVTSGPGNEGNKKAKQRDDYKNILVLAYGEDSGVFEPQVLAVEGRKDMHRAAYPAQLGPGEYTVFYFIDESDSGKTWEKARFEYAGQFTVK